MHERTTLRTLLVALATGLMGLPSPGTAQSTAEEVAQEIEEAITPAIEAVLGALRLPEVVVEARDQGVVDSTLVGVIDEMIRRGLPAAEADLVLAQEVEAIRAGGRAENFGAFVQSQLAAGLRGRALADAIRAEHRARGIGIPAERPPRAARPAAGRGRGGAAPGGRGQQGGRGESDGRGRAGGPGGAA